MVKEYDYIVIGGGSGGIASANRAAMHGAKVILFEGKEVGGTCVNVGCVPKKVMWYGAQVAETLHRYAGEYGFDVTINKFDFATLKANRQAYIDRIHGSYERGFDNNGVERVYEYARFVDPHTVEVAGERYTAPHILIATGGHALYPNIPGSEYGITSDGFFELDEVPKRTAVIGAGYIAIEVAGVLNAVPYYIHVAGLQLFKIAVHIRQRRGRFQKCLSLGVGQLQFLHCHHDVLADGVLIGMV